MLLQITCRSKFGLRECAEIAAFFRHYGLEARKVVAHIGIEDVVGANHEAVMGEGKFPTQFGN